MAFVGHHWFIYGMSLDIVDSPVRYVGLTTKTLDSRLKEHIATARRETGLPLYLWMGKHQDVGFKLYPLEFCPVGDRAYLSGREKHWISLYRDLQGGLKSGKISNILNVSDGGLGGSLSGPDHHLFGRGYLVSGENNPNYRNGEKISGEKNPHHGKFGSDHPAFGFKHSEETRRVIAESKMGKHNSGNHNRYHTKRGIRNPDTCVDCRLEMNLSGPPPKARVRLRSASV